MSNDTAQEIPKVLDQGSATKPPIENPSDQQHSSTFMTTLRRVASPAAQAVLKMHLPMSPDIARKFFPQPSQQDRSETIDAAARSGHIDPAQAERLRNKLTPDEKPA